jgi:hypothetical protein
MWRIWSRRQDAALSRLLGHGFPSPRATLEFFYQFREEQKEEEVKGGVHRRRSVSVR